MKHIFIINPYSGRKKMKNIESRIVDLCKKKSMDYSIYFTKGPGDGERYARSLENEDPAIVYAVGGDGILNEVLNGIAGSCHILSVIPLGSGNDFCRTLEEYDKEYIVADVGRINGRYFINIACIGIDAEIAYNVSKIRKILFVPASQRYKLSILVTLFIYKYKNLIVKLGGHSVKSMYTLVAICNGRYYGGGFKIATKAQIDNGEFDIYLVEKVAKSKMPSFLLKVVKGQHESDPRMVKYNDSIVEITSDEPVVCNVDGENLYDCHYKLELVRSAITVHYNKEFIEELCGSKKRKKLH